jgi:hypothetical protein
MFGHRNTLGAIVLDGRHVANTAQCVHCGSHEEIIAGSGKKRGYCPMCKGFVCGLEGCMKECTPFEARVELTEALAAGKMQEVTKIRSKYSHIKPI